MLITMSTSVLIPEAEYLRTSYEPDREYLEGTLKERNVGEWKHGRLQVLLAVLFGNEEDVYHLECSVDQRIRVIHGPEGSRYRVPDLCVKLRDQPSTPVLLAPPLLVVEVVSPDDTFGDLLDKIRDYRAFGVPNVWIVDPNRQRLFITEGDSPREESSRIAQLLVPGFEESIIVDFNILFARL